MSDLRAKDCLCVRYTRVDAFQRYRDIAGDGTDSAKVFAVFSEDGVFMGLVEERQAALFPGRIFADLLIRRQPAPLPPDADLETILQRLGEERVDYLPVIDEDGRFIGAVSMLSVFTTLGMREQALREEREKLITQLQCELENRQVAASVFDATSEGIMVTDTNNHILLVNKAFTQTTGFSEQEAIGKTPELLKSGRHGHEFYQAMRRALEEKGAWEGEIWNRRKSGDIYPEWLHINVIPDESGKVRYYAGVFSDITQHQELRAKLLHLAYYDVLTDLPNRQLFMDRLEQAIAHARRSGSEFSLLFIDLDRFKDINDTLGHRFGDQILVHAANRLKNVVRESDTVARLGGDEFTVLLPDTSRPEDIAETAEKILAALSAPLALEGKTLFIAASIGVSRYPGDGADGESLLMNADAAMYRAKESGRGVFHFYSAAMNSQLNRRLEISIALHHALAADQLWLAWQPQVSLPDGRIIGAEVLARWEDPGGTPIPPSVFIPIAEETGLIGAIGEWAIRSLCRHGMELTCHACSNFRLAVNFSPLQVKPSMHQAILDILAESSFDPRRLEVELTETALSTGRDGMLKFLMTLGEAGVEVSVDDFGTGCSNLANLKLLPVHKLKIDQSFVCDLATDPNDRQIAAAVISMAHALGLKVIAEGVETAEQAAILTELGCDMAQGYYFSRPVPFDTLKQLLNDNGVLPSDTPTGRAARLA
jgi:diguanylate cyclase (GGDEF)-like protein/PAS domain S-box-containing protein